MMLYVGCCNQKTGLWLVDPKTETTTKLNDADVRGTSWVGDVLYYLTKRGLWLWTPDQDVCITPIENDWHGLTYYRGRLWGVDPVSDTLVEFELSGKFIARWHWKRDPKAGRVHTNDISIFNQTIWQCCFIDGISRDGVPTGHGAGHQSHSVITVGSDILDAPRIFYCASNKGQVRGFFQGSDIEHTIFSEPDAFTRGLCATREGLWVGLSMKRHGAGGIEATIVLLDWETYDPVISIPLPDTNEVYSITEAT